MPRIRCLKGRYFFSVVEEIVQNPKYFGYRGGRIEVTDTDSDSPYACYEARFLIPEAFIEGFRKTFDMKYSDKMPYIIWDYGVTTEKED